MLAALYILVNVTEVPDDFDMDMEFRCVDPVSGLHLTLKGFGAFDTAVRCAAINAHNRRARGAGIVGACQNPVKWLETATSEVSESCQMPIRLRPVKCQKHVRYLQGRDH
jgi:hypothetical protein